MQPKSLSNLTPSQLEASAEANKQFQISEAHKYYEAGMKALHEANTIKEETYLMMRAHIRNQKTLDQIILKLAIVVVLYGAFQILLLVVLIDWIQIRQSLKHFAIIMLVPLGLFLIAASIKWWLANRKKA